MSYLLEELFDKLNEHVPEYCYFGAHPGDGADYGIWVDSDVIDMCVYDGTLIRVEDLSELDDLLTDAGFIPAHVLVVNDHGNMTLYTQTATLVEDCNKYTLKIEQTEVWSIV
jgi:hypothetical protein